MQTFLPYASFSESARVLDMKRLGKQRVETLQIVLGLQRVNLDGTPKVGRTWADHPIGHMWAGHLEALVAYQRAICFEWTNNRGYRDTCLDKTIDAAGTIGGDGIVRPGDPWAPWWLGDEDFHRSHRSNLIRKKPEFYGPLFPDTPDDLPYIWPKPEDI